MTKATFERLAAHLSRVEEEFSDKSSSKDKDGVKPTLTAAQKVLKAWDAKDYFSLLGLPEPEADELGRPVWSCGEAEVSKAYRKLSLSVHPDKHPGDEEYRRAFEALNQAHRLLKDPNSREDVLRSAAEKARRRREQQEAAVDLSTRMQLNAAKNERAREMRKSEGQGLQAHILEQVRKRQEEAKRRTDSAARAAKARGQRGADDKEQDEMGQEEAAGWSSGKGPLSTGQAAVGQQMGKSRPMPESDSDEDGGAIVARNKRRKKPSFI